MVRAKFSVEFKKGNDIVMRAVCSGSKENESFFAATPAGCIILNVVNEKAAEYFEQGKEYYIDFTKTE